ncbi:MAG TPA: hypothetical protein VEA58_12680, partial [Anaerovoracaceae bacterium]|nr:hypothetical protein [Anaerovoracaceae bacterium]
QTLNSKASDVYYFGGTNTDAQPFTLDTATGKLVYNGEILETIAAADQTRLKNDSMYVDIGLGVRIIPDPLDPMNTTIVDPSSVFHYSIPGINIVGSGTTTLSDSSTISNNIYDLIGAIADQFESNTFSYAATDELYGKLSSAASEIIYNLTEVGSKTSYLNFMTDRNETRTLDLQERQLSIEGADPTSTIIKFKSQEVAYNAALQMGTKIIQPSIFDFMS